MAVSASSRRTRGLNRASEPRVGRRYLKHVQERNRRLSAPIVELKIKRRCRGLRTENPLAAEPCHAPP
jgi:hypothetical protein